MEEEYGSLVISLDFELLWGVFDKVNWSEKVKYFEKTREIIPEILKLFEKNDIACTWATVGMLFNENWEDWNENIPDKLPEYTNKKLSAYHFGKGIQTKETEKLCFAPSLIEKITQTSKQELGTHTYAHYYCLEEGQKIDAFRADLKKSKELAELKNIKFKSLVFPRNQYNKEYLDVCKQVGIENIRINPDVWYWQNTERDKIQQKVFRTGDAYIGLNDKSYKDLPEIAPRIYGQKASRLLRPYGKNKFLNKIRIKRIRGEMLNAARNNKIYHLWWHPHNFGNNPTESVRELKSLIEYFLELKRKYGMKSFNMDELSDPIKTLNRVEGNV